MSETPKAAGEDPAAEGSKEAIAPTDAGNEKPVCDLCGTLMYEWHCRIVCPACGYQRDCSDP